MTDSRVTSPADDPASVAGEKVQGSPGVLKQTKAPDENFEEIPVQDISPFHAIPDFKEPTTSACPTVVKVHDQCFCIDGPELIEKAASGGVAKIRCRVFHLDHPDDIEIALLKVANRTMPPGGTCLYPEIVRNTRSLFARLMASAQTPATFAHGGARRGESFTGNKEEDVRTVLSSRLGKKRSTISNYLVHGEYLNDEAFALIIFRSLGKDFFEKAQVPKRILVKTLKSDGRSDSEVTLAVSTQINLWATDYQEGRPLRDSQPPEEPEQPAAPASPLCDGPAPEVPAQRAFDHWQGEPATADLPSPSTIRAELQAIREAIDGVPDNDAEIPTWAIVFVPEAIGTLARIQQQAIHLERTGAEV